MISSVQEQIKILIELQKIDIQIYQLKKEMESFPASQKKMETDFDKRKAGLKTVDDAFKVLQLKQKDKDNQLLSTEEKIKKLQGQLYQLKSNKEYAAMDLEIKGCKADKSILEEDILKRMDEVDQAKQKVIKEKESLAEEKKLKEELSLLQAKIAQIMSQIADHEEKRKSYLPGAEPRLLAQYEKTLKTREGLAIVPIKNNSCGGCHMGFPPQVVNEIQIGEKMIVCESCARINYWL